MISYRSLLLSTIVLNDCFKLKTALFFIFSGITVLNNIVLTISQSHLSIAQASSSFKCLDMHTFTYATPTLITEALRFVIRVQLLLTTVTVN